MKRVLLSVFAMAAVSFAVNAQTNSITSGNIPSEDGKGYQLMFNGTATDNCAEGTTTNIPNSNNGLQSSYVMDSVGNGGLTISTDGTQEGWHNFPIRFYQENCADYNLDLTDTANQKLSLTVEASVAVGQFVVFFTDINGKLNDSLGNIVPLTVGTNELSFDNIDFHQWASTDLLAMDSIAGIHFYFRNAWCDNNGNTSEVNGGCDGTVGSVDGTFTISNVTVGNFQAVGLAEYVATKNEFSVYPNPVSEGLVSFPETMNNIQVISAQGNVVTEMNKAESIDVSGFENGLYFIQSDNGYAKFIVE